MSNLNYCIWYLDGSVINCNSEQDWLLSPALDVLAIAQIFKIDEYGRKIGQYYAYSDWYWMHEGKIYQNNISSATDYGVWVENNAPEGAISKRAIWTTDEHMEQVMLEVWSWVT